MSEPASRAPSPFVQAAALDALGEAVTLLDPEGNLAFANVAWYAATGFRPEDVVGRPAGALLSARTPTTRVGDLFASLGAGGSWHGELWCVAALGRVYLARCTISPLPGEPGQAPWVVCVQRDITEMRITAEHERERSAGFAAMVHNLPTALCVITEERFAFVNPAAASLLCIPDGGSILGTPLLSLVAQRDRLRAQALTAAAPRWMETAVGDAGSRDQRQHAPWIALSFVLGDGEQRVLGVRGARATFEGKPAVVLEIRPWGRR